jgi:hypothetical protein
LRNGSPVLCPGRSVGVEDMRPVSQTGPAEAEALSLAQELLGAIPSASRPRGLELLPRNFDQHELSSDKLHNPLRRARVDDDGPGACALPDDGADTDDVVMNASREE